MLSFFLDTETIENTQSTQSCKLLMTKLCTLRVFSVRAVSDKFVSETRFR